MKAQDVLVAAQQFATALEEAKPETWEMTKEEGQAFLASWRKLKLHSIEHAVMKQLQQVEATEYPTIQGVKHHPDIRSFAFLTEEEKKKLDEFLVRVSPGTRLTGLRRLLPKTPESELWPALIGRHLAEERHSLCCPYHYEEELLLHIRGEEIEGLKAAFQRYQETGEGEWESIQDRMRICEMCDEPLNEWFDSMFRRYLIKK